MNSRLAVAARARAATMRQERRRRVVERARRFSERAAADGDPETKLRAVFEAIRTCTNSDVELHASMSPSELFRAVTAALSGSSARVGSSESRAMGEAIDLVSRLQAVLTR